MKIYLLADGGAPGDAISDLDAMGLTDGLFLRGGIDSSTPDALAAALDASSWPIFVPISATDDPDHALDQARALADLDDRVVVRLPFDRAGLVAAHTLFEEGVPTCVGPCEQLAHALLAAKADATWVELAVGGMEDSGLDAGKVVDDLMVAASAHDLEVQILASDVRSAARYADLVVAGVHGIVAEAAALEGWLRLRAT